VFVALLKFDQSPKLLSFTSDHYTTVCTAVIAYVTITNTTVCTVVVVQRLPVPQRLVVSCFRSPLVLSIVAPKFEARWPQWRWNNYIIQLSHLILKGLLSSPFLSIIIQLTHRFCTAVIVIIPHTCTHSSVCTVEIVHCVLLRLTHRFVPLRSTCPAISTSSCATRRYSPP